MMKKFLTYLGLGLAVVLIGSMQAQALNVDIYTGFTENGGGAPYSDFVGSFTSSNIMFGTDTGWYLPGGWHPYGLTDFGADITGCLQVASSDTYSFTLTSDDGSMLYIDGSLVVDNGGGHGITAVSGSTFLTAGKHSVEVQFFEAFGGESGVDLSLPAGVTYTTPLPSSLILLAPGLLGLLGLRKRYSA
jgi:hypothetical protein